MNYNTKFTYSALAFDNYYTGDLTDEITGMTYELDMPKNYATATFSVPAGFSGSISIVPNNAANIYFGSPYNGNSPSQIGLLFMYTNGKTGMESSMVVVNP